MRSWQRVVARKDFSCGSTCRRKTRWFLLDTRIRRQKRYRSCQQKMERYSGNKIVHSLQCCLSKCIHWTVQWESPYKETACVQSLLLQAHSLTWIMQPSVHEGHCFKGCITEVFCWAVQDQAGHGRRLVDWLTEKSMLPVEMFVWHIVCL